MSCGLHVGVGPISRRERNQCGWPTHNMLDRCLSDKHQRPPPPVNTTSSQHDPHSPYGATLSALSISSIDPAASRTIRCIENLPAPGVGLGASFPVSWTRSSSLCVREVIEDGAGDRVVNRWGSWRYFFQVRRHHHPLVIYSNGIGELK